MEKDDRTLVVFVMVAIAVLVLFITWPVRGAQANHGTSCQPAKVLTELLKQRYDEVEIGWGIGAYGTRLIQIYASPRGSWSVVETKAGKTSCIVAGGSSWESVAPLVGERS